MAYLSACAGWPHDKPEVAAIKSNVSELKAHPDGNYNPDKYDTHQQQIILPTYNVFIINMLYNNKECKLSWSELANKQIMAS